MWTIGIGSRFSGRASRFLQPRFLGVESRKGRVRGWGGAVERLIKGAKRESVRQFRQEEDGKAGQWITAHCGTVRT